MITREENETATIRTTKSKVTNNTNKSQVAKGNVEQLTTSKSPSLLSKTTKSRHECKTCTDFGLILPYKKLRKKVRKRKRHKRLPNPTSRKFRICARQLKVLKRVKKHLTKIA